MRNGLIYITTNWIIENLKYINLVELFKWMTKKIMPKNHLLASRLGVDIFIILKWLIVSVFFGFKLNHPFINMIIWYLIASNLYTYFYYHNWTKDLEKSNFDLDRIKRRFLNLILAISFNTYCFAFFFAVPFSSNFKWSDGISRFQQSVLFSISNSLTVDFGPVETISNSGYTLTLIETTTAFIFLTIILSNSVPQIKD